MAQQELEEEVLLFARPRRARAWPCDRCRMPGELAREGLPVKSRPTHHYHLILTLADALNPLVRVLS